MIERKKYYKKGFSLKLYNVFDADGRVRAISSGERGSYSSAQLKKLNTTKLKV